MILLLGFSFYLLIILDDQKFPICCYTIKTNIAETLTIIIWLPFCLAYADAGGDYPVCDSDDNYQIEVVFTEYLSEVPDHSDLGVVTDSHDESGTRHQDTDVKGPQSEGYTSDPETSHTTHTRLGGEWYTLAEESNPTYPYHIPETIQIPEYRPENPQGSGGGSPVENPQGSGWGAPVGEAEGSNPTNPHPIPETIQIPELIRPPQTKEDLECSTVKWTKDGETHVEPYKYKKKKK